VPTRETVELSVTANIQTLHTYEKATRPYGTDGFIHWSVKLSSGAENTYSLLNALAI